MGRKQTKSGKIRLTEVAKLAGVSPITASRFFRNPEALSLSKRERVDSAVKEVADEFEVKGRYTDAAALVAKAAIIVLAVWLQRQGQR